jgi:hypothetical protein
VAVFKTHATTRLTCVDAVPVDGFGTYLARPDFLALWGLGLAGAVLRG